MLEPTGFALTTETIDPTAWAKRTASPSCGGFASFEGWVRDHDHGRQVLHLEYEAYETLCRRLGPSILHEAVRRFGVVRAMAVHRTGRLEIGDVAVWVGVASPHRKEAFQACSWIIDEIKRTLPIWKKEHFRDGTAQWVRCLRCSGTHLESDCPESGEALPVPPAATRIGGSESPS